MVRARLRQVAAAMLLPIWVTCVAPAVVRAMADMPGAGECHDCCPEGLQAAVPAGNQADGLPLCCVLGSSHSQGPVSTQASVPADVLNAPAVLAVAWAQPVKVTAGRRPRAAAPPGPIPPLLRTSVLLI